MVNLAGSQHHSRVASHHVHLPAHLVVNRVEFQVDSQVGSRVDNRIVIHRPVPAANQVESQRHPPVESPVDSQVDSHPPPLEVNLVQHRAVNQVVSHRSHLLGRLLVNHPVSRVDYPPGCLL